MDANAESGTVGPMARIDIDKAKQFSEAGSRELRQVRTEQQQARAQLQQSGLEARLDELFGTSGVSRHAFHQMLEQYLESEH